MEDSWLKFVVVFKHSRWDRLILRRIRFWRCTGPPERGRLEKVIPFFGLLRFTVHEEDNRIAQNGNRFSSGMAIGSL